MANGMQAVNCMSIHSELICYIDFILDKDIVYIITSLLLIDLVVSGSFFKIEKASCWLQMSDVGRLQTSVEMCCRAALLLYVSVCVCV